MEFVSELPDEYNLENDSEDSEWEDSDNEKEEVDSEDEEEKSDDEEDQEVDVNDDSSGDKNEDSGENDEENSDENDEDDSDDNENDNINSINGNKEIVRKSSKIIENVIRKKDEYHSDSSDEEDIRNTVGNIPLHWYDDYAHLGYDWDGEKLLKPERGDQLDNFLRQMEDPDFWKTVKDPQTGQNVVLTDDDIQLIKRIQSQKIPDAAFDDYAPWIEWFTSEVEKMPIRKFPEHKRSFLPSKNEERKVSKMVHALKMGWMKTRAEYHKQKAQSEPSYYNLWTSENNDEHMRQIHKHIPAPKRHLPGHAESYNPPQEYLFDKKELKEWNKYKSAPWKRKLHFVPEKYDSLREVPAYSRFIKERFLRCLDLYLCPRAIKMRLTIDAEELVPKLPSPRDLQPFPTIQSMVFEGHTDMVRCITIETKGQFLASGSDDGTVKIWEIATGRCYKTFNIGGTIRSIAWCPNTALCLIAVASDKNLFLINPQVGDKLIASKTDVLMTEVPTSDAIISERLRTSVQWENLKNDCEEWDKGIRIIIRHFKEINHVTWHGRGDYLATVMPDGQNRSVIISQLSKRRSQLPFTKSKGLIQHVLFHPIKPFLFVATQRNVRIYDLVKQELQKKLFSNSRWISSMSIHPAGDNLLVGTYDRKILWFDLDLSTKPYQTLRLHGTAVRGVTFHKRYPLFASGSDDCSLIVSHGMVYNDLLQNPLIVPLKRLENHTRRNDFGILGVEFHPIQPWVFSCGADKTIRLYT